MGSNKFEDLISKTAMDPAGKVTADGLKSIESLEYL